MSGSLFSSLGTHLIEVRYERARDWRWVELFCCEWELEREVVSGYLSASATFNETPIRNRDNAGYHKMVNFGYGGWWIPSSGCEIQSHSSNRSYVWSGFQVKADQTLSNWTTVGRDIGESQVISDQHYIVVPKIFCTN